jgi:hypothetical protein
MKDVQMGEFNKDQGQSDQTGQQTDQSAFGQFDKGQNRQDQSERGQQDRQDFATADSGFDKSSAREGQIGGESGKQMDQDGAGQQGEFGGKGDQQGGFGGKGGQQEGQDQSRAQQDDSQYGNEKIQGDNQDR